MWKRLLGRMRSMRADLLAALRSNLGPKDLGLAVGIGVAIGCLPVFGIHIFLCIPVARWLRLNLPVMYAGANISNPLFAPALIAGEVAVGQWMRFGDASLSAGGAVEGEPGLWELVTGAPDLLWSLLLGSLPIGVGLGLASGALTWAIAEWRQRARR